MNILGPLAGVNIAGGCAECDAYQRVSYAGDKEWTVVVYHDDNCTALAKRKTAGQHDRTDH